MFVSFVNGRIKENPEYKKIKNRKCCNFTIITKGKSVVRCSCWDEKCEFMKKNDVKQGTIILGYGNSSNVSYDNENHVFNINFLDIEILKNEI